MTPITELQEPIRAVLGDRDPEIPLYANSAIEGAVRTAVRMNFAKGYTLTPNRLNITPDLTDPNAFALLVYRVAVMFIAPNPSFQGYKTRAMSETFGSYRDFMNHLEDVIHRLENGEAMFSGWQHFTGWFEGLHGLCLPALMTEVKVDGSWQTLTVSEGGASSSSNGGDMDQNILFTHVGALLSGAYLLGEYKATRPVQYVKAVLNCAAGTGPVTIVPEVNGNLAIEDTITIAASAVHAEATYQKNLAAGDSLRWRCTAAPVTPENSISEVSLNLTVIAR